MPVPLPTALDGEFCLIVRDRDADMYTLVVDDVDKSSFDLGFEIPDVMKQLRKILPADIADEAIDYAKEFGAAQVVFEGWRTIPLPPRRTDPVLTFPENTDAPEYRHLPALR